MKAKVNAKKGILKRHSGCINISVVNAGYKK